MKRFRLLSLALCAVLICAAVAVSGCAQNSVRLLYKPAAPAAVPSVTAPRVTVVLFEDQRGRVDIGVRKDGTPFQPGSNVAEWVSYSLADELTRQGAQVSIATSMQQAQAGKPDYIVGGAIERVWLTEKNISNYEAVIRIQVRLYSQKQAAVTKNFGAQQDKTGVPGARLAEDTLASTLNDVLSGSASSVMALMH